MQYPAVTVHAALPCGNWPLLWTHQPKCHRAGMAGTEAWQRTSRLTTSVLTTAVRAATAVTPRRRAPGKGGTRGAPRAQPWLRHPPPSPKHASTTCRTPARDVSHRPGINRPHPTRLCGETEPGKGSTPPSRPSACAHPCANGPPPWAPLARGPEQGTQKLHHKPT